MKSRAYSGNSAKALPKCNPSGFSLGLAAACKIRAPKFKAFKPYKDGLQISFTSSYRITVILIMIVLVIIKYQEYK